MIRPLVRVAFLAFAPAAAIACASPTAVAMGLDLRIAELAARSVTRPRFAQWAFAAFLARAALAWVGSRTELRPRRIAPTAPSFILG